MRFRFVKIFGFAVGMGLVLLAAGGAFAGGKEVAEYQCKANVLPGESVERCYGCVTEEMCAKAESALKALSEAQEVTLYSLSPHTLKIGPVERIEGVGKLYNYEIIGQKLLTGSSVHEAVQAFKSSILGGIGGICFDPHHALTVKTESHLYDYVVCYECGGFAFYEDGKFFLKIGATDDPSILNKLLVKEGIPLSPYYAEQGAGEE